MKHDSEASRRFQREVKAAARLSHPNIVTAHDADHAGGSHFLVMEYVEGTDLAALVAKDGRLPIDRAIDYTLQAARGLDFAHKQGVVHRDIKPANLLVDAQGTIKILDMGLARIETGDSPGQGDVTTSGTMVGTVDFMAPEQARDTRHVDARADIYSLGCSLYYLLLGKNIYSGSSPIQILQAHQQNPIPHLVDERMDVPSNLEAVFRRMVAKKVEDRYSSMVQVISDLENCQKRLGDDNLDMPMGDDEDKTSELTIALSHRPMRSISESAVMRPQQEVAKPAKKAAAISRPMLIGGGVLIAVILIGIIVAVVMSQ
jgi:serine/threonine protein kinase